MTTKTALTIGQAHDLAGDLLRQLVPHIGDEEAIEAELQRWLVELGIPAMAQVCLASLQRTFLDCLVMTKHGDWPDHGLAFDPKESDR